MRSPDTFCVSIQRGAQGGLSGSREQITHGFIAALVESDPDMKGMERYVSGSAFGMTPDEATEKLQQGLMDGSVTMYSYS